MTQHLTNWQSFQGELVSRESDFAAMLPSHVSPARFKAVAIAAVKRDPKLLQCTPRSLFSELTKSASDGLLPDGREGVIQHYNTKVKDGGTDFHWERQAVWIPMAHGLRKRANELESILVDAQVVYQNDTLLWIQGDNPEIKHEPAQLGTKRGEGIGCYAIFKDADGRILHREVMDRDAIMAVRAKSKNPGGMLWKDFWPEAWRKTVIRRGFKTVPVGEKLDQLVTRDDEQYTFDSPAEPTNGRTLPPSVERRPPPEVVSGKATALPPAVNGQGASGVPVVGEPEGEGGEPVEAPEGPVSVPVDGDWVTAYDNTAYDNKTQEETT